MFKLINRFKVLFFSSSFFVGGRFRIPLRLEFIYFFIPQPRWLRRWYYKKSFSWWRHPSNHHWKGWIMGRNSEGGRHKYEIPLSKGERDIWGGEYCTACGESL